MDHINTIDNSLISNILLKTLQADPEMPLTTPMLVCKKWKKIIENMMIDHWNKTRPLLESHCKILPSENKKLELVDIKKINQNFQYDITIRQIFSLDLFVYLENLEETAIRDLFCNLVYGYSFECLRNSVQNCKKMINIKFINKFEKIKFTNIKTPLNSQINKLDYEINKLFNKYYLKYCFELELHKIENRKFMLKMGKKKFNEEEPPKVTSLVYLCLKSVLSHSNEEYNKLDKSINVEIKKWMKDSSKSEYTELSYSGMFIPKVLWTFTHLKKLDLSGKFNSSENKITFLPSDIGNLSLLEELNLQNNELKELPIEIGNLSKLEKLNLSNNKFEKFPNIVLKLCNKYNLKEFMYNYNYIEKIPKDIVEKFGS